jgi:hypothetical protein
MNLADYLSELLGQRSAVSVPGLGYFEKVRIDGYYNDSEAKFYPPHHQVRFKPEASDDDTFAEYIARKKNISLASSKYFIEKFISKLKEDAAEGTFPFSGLGSVRMEDDQLIFTPNDNIGNDPSFYGYEPVGINNAAPVSASEPISPVFNTAIPPVDAPVAEESDVEQQYIEEEEDIKRSFNVWTILMAVVVILAIGVFAAYKYDPSIFDRFNSRPPKTKTAVIPITDSTKRTNSVKTDSVKNRSVSDSITTKSTSAAVTAFASDTTTYDTLSQVHYVIRVDAFKRQKDADENINHYKSLGLDAKLLPRGPRRLYKVIVGRYTSNEAAESARLAMVNEKKIRKDSKTIKINPKK